VTALLLDLLTLELVDGTAAFIASCQTYEGGFSSASQPYFYPGPNDTPTLLSSPRPPLGEAHGGYTFCALASWVLLQPFIAAQPESSPKPSINHKTLLRWLVQMQGTEIELGGFKGRTNKLVDGCYSWWVGGSFALLEALGVGGSRIPEPEHVATDTEEEPWEDVDGLSSATPLRNIFLFQVFQTPFSTGKHCRNIFSTLGNIQLAAFGTSLQSEPGHYLVTETSLMLKQHPGVLTPIILCIA
jgi:hypothetical protein